MKILTGRWKNRAIDFRVQPGLRPTADKVRKAVVDLFAGWIEGKRVLDLYSGTGAFGLELLSAGARSAVFVELDPVRARAIRQWLEKAGAGAEAEVLSADARDTVRRDLLQGDRFDLVVLDPPYDDAGKGSLVADLEPLLKAGGFVVYECRGSQEPPEVKSLQILRDKIYGDTRLVVYGKK